MSFNPVSLRQPEECRICLDPIKEGLCHQAGGVFHVFHEACLRRAMEDARSCPLCREKITSLNGKAVIDNPVEIPPLLALVLRDMSMSIAVSENRREDVQRLLDECPDADRESLRGSAVTDAAEHNNQELVQILLAQGSIPELLRGSAVIKAARHNNLDLVRMLIAHGPIDMNPFDLIFSCSMNMETRLEVARHLLPGWRTVAITALVFSAAVWFNNPHV